jgi:hypothetical protein
MKPEEPSGFILYGNNGCSLLGDYEQRNLAQEE